MTCQFRQMKSGQKLVRINYFILYILSLISWQCGTLAAEINSKCRFSEIRSWLFWFVETNLMTALLSFTRCMYFIDCEYHEVNAIHLDFYFFISLGVTPIRLVVHRPDRKSFDSHIVYFILINFSRAAYCFHKVCGFFQTLVFFLHLYLSLTKQHFVRL